jgi:hypothetical protein
MQHTRAQHTVAIVLMELMVASSLAAQEPSARPPMIPMAERPVPESLGRVMHLVPRQNPPRPRASTRHRRAGRATWTVLGVRGGGLAGLYLGAAIDGECSCDDPGIRGIRIGVPLGAIGGGVAGFVLSR